MRAMVTGFNTDVQHDGKVYHVQTEDKGRDNPIIESLVYRGGEILAARRSSYADRAERGLTEAEIAALIEAQHNAVIADVRSGTFDVKVVRPFGEGIISGRSFDEVVLDFLRSEIGPDPLVVSLIGGAALVEGTAVTLEILVTRGRSGDGVSAADVRIRMISTSGSPRVLAQGKSDSSGRVALAVAVPALGRGAGALIVQATSGKDSAEFKQAVARTGSAAGQAANPGVSA
jgi:uncharacterized protein (UPF0335 family)